MTEDDLATIGILGLIVLMVVDYKTRKVTGSIDFLSIFVLLFGVWPVAGFGLHDVIFNSTWATMNMRIFVCAAVVFAPGLLALWLIIRARPAFFTEDTGAKE